MIDVDEIIREHFQKLNNEYSSGHLKYAGYVKEMGKIVLKEIKEEDINGIIKPFLHKWGKMQRVLGNSKFDSCRRSLTKLIYDNSPKLEDLRRKKFISIELGEFEDDIKSYYESFNELVGPIAAAKVLHIICPNFFPLWDTSIAKAFKQEYNDSAPKEKNNNKLSGDDYYRFMEQTQIFIKKHKNVISALSKQYQRSQLKIADECFLWAVRRPLYLFFEKA